MENQFVNRFTEEQNNINSLLNESIFDYIINEDKSISFYGHSFLEEGRLGDLNSSLQNNIENNIIKIVIKKIVKKDKKRIICYEKERKKLLKEKLNIYFKDIKNNYEKKKRKKNIKEFWNNLSNEEKEKANKFVYIYLHILRSFMV